MAAHLQFPDDVNTHQFSFLGFYYNPEGHPPSDIYTVPHLDFHFNMLSEGTVERIVTEPAVYDISHSQIPEDYQRIPVVDTDDDGEPDTPLIEEDMGEHLALSTSPEFQEGGEFTHTLIYGAYDEDGDGTGHFTFVEPMVTVEFFDGLEEETVVDMKTPEEYNQADHYPTKYVIEPGRHGGVFASIDGFTEFPGASG